MRPGAVFSFALNSTFPPSPDDECKTWLPLIRRSIYPPTMPVSRLLNVQFVCGCCDSVGSARGATFQLPTAAQREPRKTHCAFTRCFFFFFLSLRSPWGEERPLLPHLSTYAAPAGMEFSR